MTETDTISQETTAIATAPVVHAGDTVAYVPALCHHLDRDLSGERVFHFAHVKDGPRRKGAPLYRKGDRANMGTIGSLEHKEGARRDPKTGIITTAGGHEIHPEAPKAAWKAVVLAVREDGKLQLRIQHPHGHSLEYDQVPFAPPAATPVLHTWHLPEGA